ncbi:MAG: hypothetical protein ACOVOL_08985 [Bacteroidia bacterium]
MKKVFFFGAVALSVSLASCNKEEQTEKILNGDWAVSSLNGTVAISDQGQTETLTLKNGSGDVTLNRETATGKMNVIYDIDIPFGGTTFTLKDTMGGDITLWNNSDKDVSMTVKDKDGSTQSLAFSIVSSEKTAQEWKFNQKNVDGTETTDVNYTLKLTKK